MYQLSKNCNQYFFREFIRELAIELKLRPKKSKSRGSVGKNLSLPSLSIKHLSYLKTYCSTWKESSLYFKGNGTLRRDLATNMGLGTLKSSDKAQERLINMFKGDLETGSRHGDQQG